MTYSIMHLLASNPHSLVRVSRRVGEHIEIDSVPNDENRSALHLIQFHRCKLDRPKSIQELLPHSIAIEDTNTPLSPFHFERH